MSELGDLLEVLHGAHRSFTSVRLEVREWRHNHRLHPWHVVTGLDLAVSGETRVVGRDGAVVAARPLFGFVPEAGEEVVRPDEVGPRDVVTVEEAARRASFTVLVPRPLGRGWGSHVLYTPGHERAPVREAVQLLFSPGDSTHGVSLRQTAGPFESWRTNGTEEVERGGRSLRVSVGPWHRVLVELALALTPAPLEPPLVA